MELVREGIDIVVACYNFSDVMSFLQHAVELKTDEKVK